MSKSKRISRFVKEEPRNELREKSFLTSFKEFEKRYRLAKKKWTSSQYSNNECIFKKYIKPSIYSRK